MPLRTHARPGTQKLAALRTKLEAQAAAELRPVSAPRPAPAPPVATVRSNEAAILRETALYRKKQAGEAAALRRFEAELRDDSDYAAWRARMQALDDENECAAALARAPIYLLVLLL